MKCCNLAEITAKKTWVIRLMACPFTSSIWAGLTLSFFFIYWFLFIYFYYLQSALRMIHLTDQNSQRTNLHYVGLKIELNKSQFCEPIVNRFEKSFFQQITINVFGYPPLHALLLKWDLKFKQKPNDPSQPSVCWKDGIWTLRRSLIYGCMTAAVLYLFGLEELPCSRGRVETFLK